MAAGDSAMGGATTGAALSAKDIHKQFGDVVALDGVTVDAESGGCLALVGESGSGKTTLLRCFNRLVEPDRGEIRLGDTDVASADPVMLRRHIGYVPQDGGLLPHWRVARNVELVLRLRGDRDAPERARRALVLVGLDADKFAHRWPRELSGGQRQRVALARALAAEPTVLLLDEPFGALDAITRSELQDAFAALRARLSTSCVLVTHDLHEAMLLATRIAVMRAGRVEQCSAPAALASNPATPYVRMLLQRARIEQPVAT
ncbi:MAG TPA: ATP-binding cassette domain-containing protein [Gemmatimonadaceae bacterium]|jgi:osmoprotectant transport system ATP-binding protein|nr:ATP-binding cassette domain-containing protein [Gemmatimonadaceae bacterium]